MNMTVDFTAVLKAAIDKMPAQHICFFACVLVGTSFAAYCVTLDHNRKMALLNVA